MSRPRHWVGLGCVYGLMTLLVVLVAVLVAQARSSPPRAPTVRERCEASWPNSFDAEHGGDMEAWVSECIRGVKGLSEVGPGR